MNRCRRVVYSWLRVGIGCEEASGVLDSRALLRPQPAIHIYVSWPSLLLPQHVAHAPQERNGAIPPMDVILLIGSIVAHLEFS